MSKSFVDKNFEAVASLLNDFKWHNVSELAVDAGLSRSTVERILKRYSSYFESHLYTSGKRGRPTMMYRLTKHAVVSKRPVEHKPDLGDNSNRLVPQIDRMFIEMATSTGSLNKSDSASGKNPIDNYNKIIVKVNNIMQEIAGD